jgi:hypothetical protein
MWSVGCIFYELLMHHAMLQGKGEMDQIDRMFRLLGTPDIDKWPSVLELPHAKRWDFFKKQHPYDCGTAHIAFDQPTDCVVCVAGRVLLPPRVHVPVQSEAAR